MADVAVTICEPHEAAHVLPAEPQFHKRVHISTMGAAHFDSHGEAHSATALDFADTRTMNIRVHKLQAGRRDVPTWALNNSQLLRVVVHCWEVRAFGNHLRKHLRGHPNATPAERLQLAQTELERKIGEDMLPLLDRLCHEFVESRDPERRKLLAQRARGIDSHIRMTRRGPGALVRILHLAFRCGYESTAIAAQTGCTATFVRQAMHRAAVAWARLNGFEFKPRRWPSQLRSESEGTKNGKGPGESGPHQDSGLASAESDTISASLSSRAAPTVDNQSSTISVSTLVSVRPKV